MIASVFMAVFEGGDSLPDATSRIVRESIFGALAVVLLFVCLWLLRKVIDGKESQIKDQKETTSTLISVTTKFTEATKEFTSALNGLKDATEDLKDVAESRNKALEDLNTTNYKLSHQITEMRADLDRWRVDLERWRRDIDNKKNSYSHTDQT